MMQRFILIFLILSLFFGCIKPDEYERANPRDINYKGTNYAEVGLYSFNIVSDDNSNGIVNAGENISLNVYLKNNGSSISKTVRGLITCSNTYVSAVTPNTSVVYRDNSSVDYIQSGSISLNGNYPNNSLSFHVSTLTPPNTTIIFNVLIKDESKSWPATFTITTQ